jgi:uncharacterized protein (TIGR02284 family)
MADTQTVNELNRLIRICIDGEAGFLVVSESVRNRGLKALFKTYAQQRSQFADMLKEEVKKLGGTPRMEGTMPASLHRGWINIKAAMTIGQYSTENVALSESERGERTAVRTYEKVLAGSLPADIKTLVQDQHYAIKGVHAQIQQMQGRSGSRMVVRLFDGEEAAEAAVSALTEAGFNSDSIQKIDVDQVVSVYEEHGARSATTESAAAGAFGGTLLGAGLGLIFGLATLFVPEINVMGMGDMGPVPTLIVGILLGAGVGAGFGVLFGGLIGSGTAEEDKYLYAESVAEGRVLLTVEADSKRAQEASEIMLQINAARK